MLKQLNDQEFFIDTEFQTLKELTPLANYNQWKQHKERILVINSDINDYLVDEIILPIIQWNIEDEGKETREPIKIYINTDGGDIDVAMGIIGVIQASKTPVYTIVLGKAYSAGALILVAGHKRFGYKHSNILIHEGTTGVMNSTSKTEDFINFSKRQKNRIKKIFAENTKITPEMYDSKYREEWYMFSDEALELGILDEIIV